MNPIQYHNTIAALVESQKQVIETYEKQIAELRELVAKLQVKSVRKDEPK